MATGTYPIGSVIKVRDLLALVIGIRMDEENNKLIKHYLIVPYPTGYSGWEHVRAVPAAEATLVSEGFRHPVSEPFLKYMDLLDVAADNADAKTIHDSLENAVRQITKGGN